MSVRYGWPRRSPRRYITKSRVPWMFTGRPDHRHQLAAARQQIGRDVRVILTEGLRVHARHVEPCRVVLLQHLVPHQRQVEVAGARAVRVEGCAVFPALAGDGAAAQRHGGAGRHRCRTMSQKDSKRRASPPNASRMTFSRFCASVMSPWARSPPMAPAVSSTMRAPPPCTGAARRMGSRSVPEAELPGRFGTARHVRVDPVRLNLPNYGARDVGARLRTWGNESGRIKGKPGECGSAADAFTCGLSICGTRPDGAPRCLWCGVMRAARSRREVPWDPDRCRRSRPDLREARRTAPAGRPTDGRNIRCRQTRAMKPNPLSLTSRLIVPVLVAMVVCLLEARLPEPACAMVVTPEVIGRGLQPAA